ncbi:hypothetical protein [Azospira inquinata]|uniref:Uncharacterized protein n=1 Tax=Azospira inquinata TaxID=2785627 RepID=A0A975SK21_9RHOO|nr:hypothetical protein [Azospira inquinata]QWT46904.1 hypothetical protein J8L76_04125 [Azospira inquinata]QWT47773.1 hypothetical protein Azoinq_07745 [Azospira inquinata]
MSSVAFFFLYLYVFWVLFLACAALYQGWHQATPLVKVLAVPLALTAFVVDLVFNYTFAVLLFLQWPPQGCYTLTKRISYYKNHEPGTWRGKVGKFICQNFLDPFQQGGHCS